MEAKPLMVEDKEEVTEEVAKKKVEEIIQNAKENVEIEYIKSTGQSDGKLDIYTFEAKTKDSDEVCNIEITKKGGMLSLFIYDRNVKEKKLTAEECEKIGLKYLKKIGIENMKATYYLEVENMITINYAAVQESISQLKNIYHTYFEFEDLDDFRYIACIHGLDPAKFEEEAQEGLAFLTRAIEIYCEREKEL